MATEYDLLVSAGTSMADDTASMHFKKATPPITGDKFGAWGNDFYTARLPGGSVMTFDLSRLTIEDYRQMRGDYQINASLQILMGMMAQADFGIYTKGQETDPKLKAMSDTLEEGIRRRWLPLIRAWSTSLWAGYAPTVLNYELNPQTKYYEVTKYKDLLPDFTRVDWDVTTQKDGTQIRTYSGIINQGRSIPGKNTLWYPMLMEHGNMYGRKLLKPAFGPWFFSQLIHLYTNRYFERFGEPTAVGYYPQDQSVTNQDGTVTSSRELMANVLTGLRSRGVVTIPSERDPETHDLEWDIKYLESQMRGADFDRYLSRLDEEKSLALFTPVLMFRTGERGSYALGEIHRDVFQWMLNMLAEDFKGYIDEFLITPLHDINFGPNAPRSEIRFRTLGRISSQGAQSTLTALIQNGGAKVTATGLKDLGDFLGVDLEYLNAAPAIAGPAAAADPSADPSAPPAGDPHGPTIPNLGLDGIKKPDRVPVLSSMRDARQRLVEQITRTYSSLGDGHDREQALERMRMGFKGAIVNDLVGSGLPPAAADAFFTSMEGVVRNGITSTNTELDAVTAVRGAFAQFGLDASE